MTSAALLTDLYELTMSAALFAEGRAEVPVTFSLFVRSLPPSRGYLVVAGLEDVLDHLDRLAFTEEDRVGLASLGLFDRAFLDWLGGVRFTGTVRAIPEGRIAFHAEPLVEVTAPFAVAQMLETYLLNQVTYQTVLATKAARCRHAAGGRPVVDFSLRRTHGAEAGMRVARASAIVGLAGTSNVAAALRYGFPASGTMAHSYVSAHAAWGAGGEGGRAGGEATELDAFRTFARHYRADPVLLVDTYDTLIGIDRAIVVARELEEAGRRLAGVRLDSGDIATLARAARERLDAAGLPGVRIIASGGIDEYEIDRLLSEGAPLDGFGVGTRLGTSEDAPSLETVYKLVEVAGLPVAKRSEGKASTGGAKQVWRRPGFGGDVV
ncbi:MAG TPA: nicotinate phosphoribosyltransferase, partial [Acidimicrobiia bacterium]|nr:nicotinate phosphoribosyltransferase [Acidimicrobiia bacterium]